MVHVPGLTFLLTVSLLLPELGLVQLFFYISFLRELGEQLRRAEPIVHEQRMYRGLCHTEVRLVESDRYELKDAVTYVSQHELLEGH